MKILDECVPYSDRHVLTTSGVALVWPFINVAKGKGPYELFLDTNALSKTKWIQELPREIRENAILNPWPALVEQWLSNAKFREDSSARIEWITNHTSDIGIPFRPGYAEEQTSLLKANEAQLRMQCSLLFPYVAMMKSLMPKGVGIADLAERLSAITGSDVPRFTGNIMLMALLVALKSKQSLKLAGDSKPAFSYLESFLAFQPGKKDETERICIPYLRNRSGDLSLWYSVPMLAQHGYRFIGEPVVVTGDNALHRVILRLLPPVADKGGALGFALYPGALDPNMESQIMEAAFSNPARHTLTAEERVRRMNSLFKLAESYFTDEEGRDALAQAWREWCKPGLGLKMILS